MTILKAMSVLTVIVFVGELGLALLNLYWIVTGEFVDWAGVVQGLVGAAIAVVLFVALRQQIRKAPSQANKGAPVEKQ